MYTYKARFQALIARYLALNSLYTLFLFQMRDLFFGEFQTNLWKFVKKTFFVYIRKYVWRAKSDSLLNWSPWIFKLKNSMTCDVRGGLLTYWDDRTSVHLGQMFVKCLWKRILILGVNSRSKKVLEIQFKSNQINQMGTNPTVQIILISLSNE